jgi:retron-type reverse transcriptase
MHDSGDLAVRLGVKLSALRWLTYHRRGATVVHYHRFEINKKTGGVRCISAPKAALARAQRWVLDHILAKLEVEPQAHGFVPGRSALTHARAHSRQRVVVRLDLEDFFAAVTAARVYGIFRTAGYPEAVAHALTGLCTNVVPTEQSVAGHYRLARRLATPHLPQGAPTSPGLANLAAFRLDARLAGLARELGATYTRYADDLVLSCDHRLRVPVRWIERFAREEGFRVNRAKTRVMSRAGRQTVTGIVVNERLNVPRPEYDRLKAILHRGGDGLDLAHLEGRVAWVESLNPVRGAKLRARLDELRSSA